ncbi:MAG: ATP-binding protein [Terriglobales bacterium]
MPNLPSYGQETLSPALPAPPPPGRNTPDWSAATLAEAFRDFNMAAAGLEQSYGDLQAEVARLRREVRGKNRALARRAAENQRLQALAEVTAVLAHEIRNPLASLELYAGLLAEVAAEGEPAEWVAQMQAGLRLLAATVNNVLQWQQGAAPQLAPVPVGALLRSTAEFLRPLAARQGVALRIEAGPAQAELAADHHRVQQVLCNLSLNALRAMARGAGGGLRWIARSEGARRIAISVQDEGPGFAPADLPRVFTPGFSTAGGAGLGLAVCRQIVRQHGGEISAANAPQGAPAGAIVTFRLWRWPAPAAAGALGGAA